MSSDSLLRVLLLAALVVGSSVVTPTAVSAAPARDDEGAAFQEYLAHLLEEINVRRDRAGTPRLSMAPESAIHGVAQYLEDLTPMMISSGSCFHGAGRGAGWDYAAAAGFAAAARGEVIACPGPDGYWTAGRIAEAWWASATHKQVLFTDPDANLVACATYGAQHGGVAYLTIACVTYAG